MFKDLSKTQRMFSRTGEVTEEVGLEAHILRYWEARFGHFVRPIRRADGRRMYRPEDIQALKAIKLLVRERGLTLKAAQSHLKAYGVEKILNADTPDIPEIIIPNNAAPTHHDHIKPTPGADARHMQKGLISTLERLEAIKHRIDGTEPFKPGRLAA